MAHIPPETKISLINKYIQLNILKPKGKDMYMDIPENDIFNAIIQDMKAFNEEPETPKKSLDAVVRELKGYQENQTKIHRQFKSLKASLQMMLEQQDNPEISLQSIITDLESFK